MSKLTMCGYRCDLYKAFAENIKKKDEHEKLSAMWMKYYSGLNILQRFGTSFHVSFVSFAERCGL